MTQDYDLAAIKSHPDFPFANWQSDDLSFLMTELYWSRLARDTIGPDAAAWKPEFDTERDGNPILTIAHRDHLRALRVVLLPPLRRSEGPETADPEVPPHDLYAYLNVGRLADGETEVNELVILVRTGAGTEPIARKLIHLQCVAFAPPEAIEAGIEDYERRLGLL